MIELGAEAVADPKRATGAEWLETNGLGGFAASTVPGLNSRRYHGLLIASLRPPVDRFLLLAKLEETLVLRGERVDLGSNQYAETVHPQGYRLLRRFSLEPFPTWTFQGDGFELEKRLFLVQGENTLVVCYRLLSAPEGEPLRLELRPLLAFRDYHSLGRENGSINGSYEETPGRVTLQPYAGLPPLYLAHHAAEVEAQGFWYRGFRYREETARGLDDTEDLFNPLALHFDLRPGETATVVATLDPHREAGHAALLEDAERQRRALLAESAPVDHPLVRSLACAADQFISRRGAGETILAGFPWFTDWGRDTMIALPGLALVTGRHETARQILREFARHVDQGMLPNRFPDRGEEPDYNTVDATLWFFEAVRAYEQYTRDLPFIRDELYPVLRDIIVWHQRGTRHGIRVEPDGLLHAGEPGSQLTWMDAKVGDYVVTPRSGKPVEIQALWYHALRVMADLARRLDTVDRTGEFDALADRVRESFNRLFWSEERGYLADVVDGETADCSLRPNQVIAASLRHSMLPAERALSVVETVRRHLLAPCGLRTLSPEDRRYCGVYEGDPWNRDTRYHQGTVWPWLLGPFITAYVRTHGGSAAARAQAARWLEPLQAHLLEGGLGQVSEILDGDPPHHPRGCFAQAWSVGEILRCAVEDVWPLGPA